MTVCQFVLYLTNETLKLYIQFFTICLNASDIYTITAFSKTAAGKEQFSEQTR